MINDIRQQRINALVLIVYANEHLFKDRHSFHFIEILEREYMFTDEQYAMLRTHLFNEVIELPKGSMICG